MAVVSGSVRMLIVRHGQQERIGDDGPLTSLGVEQAAATALAIGLTPADRLVSSRLQRAVQAASALGREPEKLGELDEFRFGPMWTWDQADVGDDLSLWRPDDRPPGGESLREFQIRVEAALTSLLETPPAGRLIIVVHSGVIDAILRWAFGSTPDTPWTTEAEVGCASITELQHWPVRRHPSGAPRHTLIVRVGDVSHLPSSLITDT